VPPCHPAGGTSPSDPPPPPPPPCPGGASEGEPPPTPPPPAPGGRKSCSPPDGDGEPPPPRPCHPGGGKSCIVALTDVRGEAPLMLPARLPLVRGLHSFTFRLNFSAFCGTGVHLGSV